MNKKEFQTAVTIAQNDSIDLGNEDLGSFDGFGLADFAPVTVTLRQVARLIRWQCQQFSGGYDMEALQEIRDHGRRRFDIVSFDTTRNVHREMFG
jgi:hypothetical protein